MEKAVNNLEALFQKAEVDLNYLTRRLQMDSRYASNDEVDPISLIAQVEEVKAEHLALTKDITAIQAAQKETVSYCQTSILKLSELLSKLETQSGAQENTEVAQAVMELTRLLGEPDFNLPPQAGDKHLAAPGECSVSSKSHPSVVKSKQKEPVCPAVSAVDRSSRSSEFVAVTSEEFKSVSKLVRGKVKLDDLNRTYGMLWQHFKIEGKKDALTPQQMNSMGLRVSGATGEAKLKVLRALKLCEISRNGDVKLC